MDGPPSHVDIAQQNIADVKQASSNPQYRVPYIPFCNMWGLGMKCIFGEGTSFLNPKPKTCSLDQPMKATQESQCKSRYKLLNALY